MTLALLMLDAVLFVWLESISAVLEFVHWLSASVSVSVSSLLSEAGIIVSSLSYESSESETGISLDTYSVKVFNFCHRHFIVSY